MRLSRNASRSLTTSRRLLLISATIAATIGAAFIMPTGAAAHSRLVASDPADGSTVTARPTRAILTFNEPIIAKGSAFTLIDRTKQAPRPLSARYRDAKVTLTLPAQIATGPVTINYRIVSADGHPVTGKVAFTYQVGGSGGAGSGGAGSGGAGSGGAGSGGAGSGGAGGGDASY